jgi:hypothetical protein
MNAVDGVRATGFDVFPDAGQFIEVEPVDNKISLRYFFTGGTGCAA